MFRSCFVARLKSEKLHRSVEIIARHDVSGKKSQELPSAQNLGTFCFPLGPEHVTAKEYMAPEVRCACFLACLTCFPFNLSPCGLHAGVFLHTHSRRRQQATRLL